MSYDIYLEIDTGGEHPATVHEVGNYTSNVTPIWKLALGFHLSDLHGELASTCIPHLAVAVTKLYEKETMEAARKLQPSNGWGDLEGAREYLEKFLVACRLHPKCSVRISH